MKLRNKLIPLISLTATATTIAPLASCGNISLSETTMVDVMHGYLPEIGRAEASETLTAEQAKDLYVQHVKNNPEIFAQDLYWWESLALKYRLRKAALGNYGQVATTGGAFGGGGQQQDGSFMSDLYYLYGLSPATTDPTYSFDMVPTVAKFSVSDIKIGEEKLVNTEVTPAVEDKGFTISMKMNVEYKYEINADCVHGTNRYSAKRETTLSMTSEYKNIPFTVMWDTEWATWRVLPVGWFNVPGNDSTWIVRKLQNWSFNFEKTCITVDTIKSYDGAVDTYTYDESQGGLIDSYAKLVKWMESVSGTNIEAQIRSVVFNFGSYHLYDIMGPQWSWGNLGYRDNTDYYTNYQPDLIIKTKTYYAFNRNWTVGEYKADTRPTDDAWKLISCSAEKLPLYRKSDGEHVANVSMLPADNTNMLTNYKSTAAYLNIMTSFEFKLKPDSESTQEEKLLYAANFAEVNARFGANPEDFSGYSFTIPEGTVFTIGVPYEDSTSNTKVWKEEQIKITNDINCFWASTQEGDQ